MLEHFSSPGTWPFCAKVAWFLLQPLQCWGLLRSALSKCQFSVCLHTELLSLVMQVCCYVLAHTIDLAMWERHVFGLLGYVVCLIMPHRYVGQFLLRVGPSCPHLSTAWGWHSLCSRLCWSEQH